MWWWWFACGPGPLAPGAGGVLPSATPEVFRFAAVGDAGHLGAIHARVAAGVAATCAQNGCDVVVLLGDNLYPAGVTGTDDLRLSEVVAPYLKIAPVALVLGNHDYGARGRDPAAAERQVAWAQQAGVTMPGKVWEATAGSAQFVALDTTRAFWWGEADQLAWLRTLPASSGWRVVLAHHPWRSEGPHGNAGAYEGWPGIPWLSGAPVARLYDRGVCGNFDLVLSAHDHLLEHLPGPCGETLVVSGGGSSATEVVDRADDPLFVAAVPGFVWVSLGATADVEWRDAEGGVLHRAALASPRTRSTE